MDTVQSEKKSKKRERGRRRPCAIMLKLFLFQLNDKQQSSQKPAKSNFPGQGRNAGGVAMEWELDS